MSDYTEVQVCDAIIADLETLSLPTHAVMKYVQPRLVRMDVNDRVLSVYVDGINPSVIATPDAYDNNARISICWYAPVFKGADANEDDEVVAAAALAECKVIRKRLQSYAAGVPALTNVSAVLTQVQYAERGAVTWKAQFDILVEEFEGGPDNG